MQPLQSTLQSNNTKQEQIHRWLAILPKSLIYDFGEEGIQLGYLERILHGFYNKPSLGPSTESFLIFHQFLVLKVS